MSMVYNASTFLDMIQDGYKYTTHYKKNVRETNEQIEKYEEKMTDLRKSIKNLNQYKSTTTTKEKLEKHLKTFVKTYNEVKENSPEKTNKKLSKSIKELENLMETHEKELKKLGIRENTKGEVIFDKEKYKDVEQKDIDKLFAGKGSFVNDLYKITKSIQKQASEAHYDIVNRTFYTQTPFEQNDIIAANMSLDLSLGINKCESVNTLIQTGGLTEEQIRNVHNNMNDFVFFYNSLISAFPEYSQVNQIIQKSSSYQNELSTIGISIDESFKTLSYTAPDSIETDTYKVAFETLFGNGDASYNNILKQNVAKIYTTALDTESHGISIDMQL